MLGAVVFCVWEDIVACNQKMILVFVCSMHEMKNERAKKVPVEKDPLEEPEADAEDLGEAKPESTPEDE
jgi:hypothetical protein